MIRAVVFDFGQVLASGDGVTREPARLLGVDPDAFAAEYWKGRLDYDRGGTETAYWTPILTALGVPAAPETIQHLAALDAQLWLDVRPDALQLLRDTRASGRLVAILSNAPFPFDLAVFGSEVAEEADYWFVSASMGVCKPDPAAYHRVTEVLELPPAEIAFVDDRSENVAGAQAVGWQAHLWASDADTRAWLVGLGVLAG